MPEGFNIDDGWVVESSVHHLAEWYNENCPETSRATFEAHLMVLRAYVTLLSGSPLDVTAGLSRARYNVLRLLYQAPEKRLLMGDFAEGMNVSPTNISKLVDSLVADGLVRRTVHEIDKRKTWALLTDEGEGLVKACLPAVSTHVNDLWASLDEDEKKVLAHLLSKLRMNVLAGKGSKTLSVLRRLQAAGSHAAERKLPA
jgi:DNA-binding MarR family transcriptional regulator